MLLYFLHVISLFLSGSVVSLHGSALKVGDRVFTTSVTAGAKVGILRFLGPTEFAQGMIRENHVCVLSFTEHVIFYEPRVLNTFFINLIVIKVRRFSFTAFKSLSLKIEKRRSIINY